ncbi:MAG: ABC-type amino acid transport substrate-binding protein [Pseudohongiellaceae bacterium]|jgi:ABC-type amino acid transport substrate-binding protein
MLTMRCRGAFARGTRSLQIALGVALLCLSSACTTTTSGQPPSGVAPAPTVIELVVASDLDNMPFAGLDAEGHPIGRDVEMMAALAAQLQRPLRWRRMPFEQLLPSVEEGTVDVVCATVGITAEREQRVDFSDAYFSTAIEVVVRRGEGEPQTWADLAGRRVGAGRGTTSEFAVRRVLPEATGVYENKSHLGSLDRLLQKDVDGLAMDGPNALELVGQHGDKLTLLLTPLASERYGLVVGEGQRELTEALNAALNTLRQSGFLAELNVTWGLQPTD